MTDQFDAPENASGPDQPTPLAFEPGSKKDRASRFWRAVWRVHFYAGMAVLPFLVILAVTGTTILYKDNINNLFEQDIRFVDPSGEPVSLDDQVAVVDRRVPRRSGRRCHAGEDR